MADMIQLTPEELLQQAAQMTSLQEQYSSMFGELEKILSAVNGSWSANLASNFLSKITGAKNVFARVLQMLDGGINAATTAANSFASVDAELAKLFGSGSMLQEGSKFLQEFASAASTDPHMLSSLLSKSDIAKYYEALTSGDASQITDILFKGFTDDAKGKITDLIKDKTGLKIDSSIIEKAKSGDVSGALFDIAGASNSIFNSGGLSPVGIATDFLLQTAKNSTDRNNWVAKETDVYVGQMLDNFEKGDLIGGLGGLVGYLADVAPRNLANAGGKVAYHVADGVCKSVTGHSLTEIDNKVGDIIGVKPSKVVHDVTEGVSNWWSSGVKKVTGGIKDAIKSVTSDAHSSGGNALGGIVSAVNGLKSLF